MTPVASWTRRRLVGVALAVVALAAPAVALAATLNVTGTSGDDLAWFIPEGSNQARVVLNGAAVGSASSGDTVNVDTRSGDDVVSLGPTGWTDGIIWQLNLGRGDDVAVAAVDAATSDENVGVETLRLGSGRDRWGLHYDQGDPTGAIRVEAGSGNDRGTVRSAGRLGSTETPPLVRLGPGADRMTVVLQAPENSFRAEGGSGNDRMRVTSAGPAQMWGGPGNDQFHARDGNADTIRCGRGRDRVTADRSDAVSSSCERVFLPSEF